MKELSVCNVKDYIYYEDLAFYPQNAEMRIITVDNFNKLKNSLIERGFFDPVHVWLENNFILAGNHRVKAAIELIDEGYVFKTKKGDNYFPCVIHDCDETTALGIVLQTNSSYAEWIETALSAAIQDYENKGGNTSILAFTTEEVTEALEEAITSGEAIIEEIKVEEEEIRESIHDVNEDYGSLVLPLPIHRQLTEILSEVAKRLSSDWQEGDHYQEAVQAVCQKWRENKMTEKI